MLLVGVYILLARTDLLDSLMDSSHLKERIRDLGIMGPLAVIGLLALAIVISPIPSAPIALASGAAYGHQWGTVYVLIGAELGAFIAFFIARLLGYEILRSWFGEERLSQGLLGSQNTLMGLVFVTRLLPFISFDLVSYAAGLTALSVWRFALATLAGIIPASILLSHFGVEMVSGNPRRITLAVLLLGSLTLIPLGIGIYRSRKTKSSVQKTTNE